MKDMKDFKHRDDIDSDIFALLLKLTNISTSLFPGSVLISPSHEKQLTVLVQDVNMFMYKKTNQGEMYKWKKKRLILQRKLERQLR